MPERADFAAPDDRARSLSVLEGMVSGTVHDVGEERWSEEGLPSQHGNPVMKSIPVFVFATDAVSQIGIAGQLRARSEVALVDDAEVDAAQVAVVVADDVDAEAARVVRAVQRNGCPRAVGGQPPGRRPRCSPASRPASAASCAAPRPIPTPSSKAFRPRRRATGPCLADLLGRLAQPGQRDPPSGAGPAWPIVLRTERARSRSASAPVRRATTPPRWPASSVVFRAHRQERRAGRDPPAQPAQPHPRRGLRPAPRA